MLLSTETTVWTSLSRLTKRRLRSQAGLPGTPTTGTYALPALRHLIITALNKPALTGRLRRPPDRQCEARERQGFQRVGSGSEDSYEEPVRLQHCDGGESRAISVCSRGTALSEGKEVWKVNCRWGRGGDQSCTAGAEHVGVNQSCTTGAGHVGGDQSCTTGAEHVEGDQSCMTGAAGTASQPLASNEHVTHHTRR